MKSACAYDYGQGVTGREGLSHFSFRAQQQKLTTNKTSDLKKPFFRFLLTFLEFLNILDKIIRECRPVFYEGSGRTILPDAGALPRKRNSPSYLSPIDHGISCMTVGLPYT